MRICPCCYNYRSSCNLSYTSRKNADIHYRWHETKHADKDYPKEIKQMAYVAGVAILGITGIVMGAKGKITSFVK